MAGSKSTEKMAARESVRLAERRELTLPTGVSTFTLLKMFRTQPKTSSHSGDLKDCYQVHPVRATKTTALSRPTSTGPRPERAAAPDRRRGTVLRFPLFPKAKRPYST